MSLRRSNRLQTVDPQGRDYLSTQLRCSRTTLENLVTSSTFRPHLQLWYRLCVASERRFNDGADWINTGLKGYFYNESDLEEDLLLMCLGEGEDGCGSDGAGYADDCAITGKWMMQELWARTAWRIVHANHSSESPSVFEKISKARPIAWFYGFVIELLCIAFHSLAFRGQASCWEGLINGHDRPDEPRLTAIDESAGMDNDDMSSSASTTNSTNSTTTSLTLGSNTTETSDHTSDADFNAKKIPPRTRITTVVDGKPQPNTAKPEMVQEWIDGVLATGFRGPRIFLDPADEIITRSVVDQSDSW